MSLPPTAASDRTTPSAAVRSQEHLDVHGQGIDLSAAVGRHARSTPDVVAVTFEGAHLTYAQLDARAAQLAGVLQERGVRTGDRVAVLMQNRSEYVEALVAITRLQAIAVPLNFRLTVSEVHHQLADSGTVVVLTDAALEAVASEAAVGSDVTAVISTGETWERALAEATPVEESRVDDASCAAILYTSGTTGAAKGAMLSHRSLATYVAARWTHLGLPSTCRTTLVPVPLFHIAGFVSLLTSVQVGGRVVIVPSGAFDPARMVELFVTERINLVFLVPAQWQAIVRSPAVQGHDFPDLVSASWGGAPASDELVTEIRAAFPHARISTSFGQTELCATATILRHEDAITRPSSVGKPMLHVEARLVDPDMNDVPVGTVGEIVYRGPTVMMGYWNAPEKTAEAFRGGWFHSGDLLRADDDGFLYVVDRLKDMIISGGENVYCAEVERVLAEHHLVSSVAVIGVPDERWGEVPLAVVVPRGAEAPAAADLEAFARLRLAAYKVPKRLVVVEELPSNAGGKVLKGELRKRFIHHA